jgi:YidC/Oxa1 family membrane protein insertase
MAETVNSGGNSPVQPPKEMSMEMRLLLAFLLMGAVMFLTPYFFKSPPAAGKKAETAKTAPAAQTAPAAPETAPPNVAAEAAPAVPAAGTKPSGPATPQQPLPLLVIDTDLFRVTFSNQGATLRSWLLKKYRGNDSKMLELMNTAAGIDFPFSLYFAGQQPTARVNWTYYQQTVDPDGLGVTFEYTDGHTAVRKVFRFHKDSYLSQISTDVTVDGKPLPHMIQWRGGFGDLTVAGAAATQQTLYFNVAENSLVQQGARAAKNGPVTASGDFSFAGLEDKYFAAVLLPTENNVRTELVTFSNDVRTSLETTTAQFPGMAVGSPAGNRFDLFVGPKDLDVLRRVNPKLEQVVDFGKWLGFLAKPLFLVVSWFNSAFVHNYGWAIVLVTIVINFVLFPLKLSNMKSMRKMTALKPQIDLINQRYKNIGMRDPRKAEQNQEVMALYKQHGVNPMGGCFPMLLQIPFFFAFYRVFTVSVEMRGASWLWVTDLSQPEHLAIKVLPLVMIGSQFLMQKMTPQGNVDPNQQKMMMFMPLIFGFMFYNFPSGLVLYYLTSNLVNMGQQWFFNHTETAQEAARSVESPKKKNGRK